MDLKEAIVKGVDKLADLGEKMTPPPPGKKGQEGKGSQKTHNDSQ